MMLASHFQKTFLRLILAAWIVPAIFGLGFLIFINMFTVDQMADILMSPIEPFFIIFSLIGAYYYFKKQAQAISSHIENPNEISQEKALLAITNFPGQFWLLFLLYLVVAPITVIYSAEYYSDFVASSIDWFRISLVALIVSIIVGLPIFFLILDLFGKIISNITLHKPVVSIKLKVILIGALVPLLIDTMLVQYYWTRTGFFSSETFIIWLGLEVLAIIGSVIFARSFSQSLLPLELAFVEKDLSSINLDQEMRPNSIDELGILTSKYHDLLKHQQEQHIILEQKVIERTIKMEEANKELEAFSYSISTELHNPAQSIDSLSKILLESCAGKLSNIDLNVIKNISKHNRRIQFINSSLTSLLKISQHSIDKKIINLSVFVQFRIELLNSKNPKRKIKLDLEENLEVIADDYLTKILVENLVGNALKNTRGQGQTDIEFGYSESKQAYFLQDNGIGFDSIDSDALFLPFQQMNDEDEVEDCSICLAVAHRIVDKHGGTIWADSGAKIGNTIYFTL